MRWQPIALITLAVVVSLAALIFATALLASGLSLNALLRGDTTAAGRLANIARPIIDGSVSLTGRRNQTLVCWQTGLELAAFPPVVLETLQTVSESYATSGTIDLQSLQTLTTQLNEKLSVVPSCLDLWIVRQLMTAKERATLLQKVERAQTALNLLDSLLTRTQRWVVMFQNITELRPTGGFTGSYALIELRNRTLQLLGVEDIYDADGQVGRFRDAPAGIREYTSGNNGLRLPDSNWWPDFPTSAQTQLDFLADAGRENLTGLASVNLSLLQDVLAITGPLALPDYDTTLTVENAPLLLRSHAEDFFPGSREKKQLLSYVLQQLLYRVATLTGSEKQALANLMLAATATGELQAFSTLPEQQAALRELATSGALDEQAYPVLALVEANVGINKANQYIQRALSLHQDDDQLVVTLNLKNTADAFDAALPASESGYVNYQRVVNSPELSLETITVDGTRQSPSTTSWTSTSGSEYSDSGVLVTVPAGQEKSIIFTLNRPDRSEPLLLWHQPGTGSTPLTAVDSTGKTSTTLFDSSTLLLP